MEAIMIIILTFLTGLILGILIGIFLISLLQIHKINTLKGDTK